ncbi:class I SAM-dependent methyltransferase [Nitrospira moscoviensis]|nr:class I SAM-dependent methyltransferase [Nitrospira moscoviensis]
MKKLLLVLMASCALSAAPATAEEHQHRRPADIKQYLEHLDSAERDQYQKPAQVIEALRLKPGMAIADLGSGSGYFTRRFVEAVTDSGMVYAVDVEPEMLAYAKESIIHMHVPYSAEFILARPDNPKLPFEAVDLIFVCNTAHHLENRAAYFRTVKSALKPGGRIAIIDFYPDERSGDLGFPKHHLVRRETIVQEMTEAGYRLEREHTFLPRQYFLEFGASP